VAPQLVALFKCPLLAQSRHGTTALRMSAFGGEADITFFTANFRLRLKADIDVERMQPSAVKPMCKKTYV